MTCLKSKLGTGGTQECFAVWADLCFAEYLSEGFWILLDGCLGLGLHESLPGLLLVSVAAGVPYGSLSLSSFSGCCYCYCSGFLSQSLHDGELIWICSTRPNWRNDG